MMKTFVLLNVNFDTAYGTRIICATKAEDIPGALDKLHCTKVQPGMSKHLADTVSQRMLPISMKSWRECRLKGATETEADASREALAISLRLSRRQLLDATTGYLILVETPFVA